MLLSTFDGWSFVTMRLSFIVIEIMRLKDDGVTIFTPRTLRF